MVNHTKSITTIPTVFYAPTALMERAMSLEMDFTESKEGAERNEFVSDGLGTFDFMPTDGIFLTMP